MMMTNKGLVTSSQDLILRGGTPPRRRVFCDSLFQLQLQHRTCTGYTGIQYDMASDWLLKPIINLLGFPVCHEWQHHRQHCRLHCLRLAWGNSIGIWTAAYRVPTILVAIGPWARVARQHHMGGCGLQAVTMLCLACERMGKDAFAGEAVLITHRAERRKFGCHLLVALAVGAIRVAQGLDFATSCQLLACRRKIVCNVDDKRYRY